MNIVGSQYTDYYSYLSNMQCLIGNDFLGPSNSSYNVGPLFENAFCWFTTAIDVQFMMELLHLNGCMMICETSYKHGQSLVVHTRNKCE